MFVRNMLENMGLNKIILINSEGITCIVETHLLK